MPREFRVYSIQFWCCFFVFLSYLIIPLKDVKGFKAVTPRRGDPLHGPTESELVERFCNVCGVFFLVWISVKPLRYCSNKQQR